jgi:protein farnesyltransferase/geranylgeranyltransferase type-1 subunit alpha
MSLDRGLLNKLELSQRALTLVTVLNSAFESNPTPWWYRQQIISALGYSPKAELDFITELLHSDPKAYQPWCHRTWIVSRCDEPPDETYLFDLIVPVDLTNFHAWEYFGWYAERFRKWTWLYEQTETVCTENPFCNSPWSCRFRALREGHLPVPEEIEFTLRYLTSSRGSECLAYHLRGLLLLDPTPANIQNVSDAIRGIEAHQGPHRSIYILAAQIARIKGNVEEYDEVIEKIAALDPVRARGWAILKSDSGRLK